MKLQVESDEQYPHLFIYKPSVRISSAYEVPDALGQAVLDAQTALGAAEQALLVWLRDEGGLSPEATILQDHLE